MSDRRQVPEGMAMYKGEFVTARMVVERLVEAERLLRICTDGREAYIKSVNTFLEITKFLGTADSDEWPTREEAEKRAAELMAIGRATLSRSKHTPECSYWDGLMAQVCNCGLAERDHNDD